jgi:hypothetical protein
MAGENEGWVQESTQSWFLRQVGGSERMVPKVHGLPWVLRIHYRQYCEAYGVEPKMSPEAKKALSGVDQFFGFNEKGLFGLGKGSAASYSKGDTMTNEAVPASDYLTKLFFTPEDMADMRKEFDELAGRVPEWNRFSEKQKQVGRLAAANEILIAGCRQVWADENNR